MNEQIVQRIKNCPSLPTLPTVAVQVLALAQSADADIAEIADIISKDPALSSKILRTVNSSFYGRSQNVSTMSHALVILGLQSVKTLVLGFSLVTNLTRNKSKGFDHITYWKRSIYAATAARLIAARIGMVQQEEAFMAALLMDIGMLVLDMVLGEQYGRICARIASHEELAPAEEESLGATHAEVGGMMANQWKLPPLLAVPVASHHAPDGVTDVSLKKLAQAVALGGRCADVFVDELAAEAIADVRRLAKQFFGMGQSDCDSFLAEVGKRTRKVASLFEINIGSHAEYEAILKKANEALVDITLRTQMQASQLQQQNEQLQQQAMKDALTGLANRAAFDRFLSEQFERAMHNRGYLSLLMLDLDRFKSINDTHGHPAGDRVLQTVGQVLRSALRPQGMAARFGGEEFALVLPGTSRQAAAAVAQSVRYAIANHAMRFEDATIQVTVSVGVACFEPGSPFRSPVQLVKATDLALYSAKHSGRDCVRVFSLRTGQQQSKPAA